MNIMENLLEYWWAVFLSRKGNPRYWSFYMGKPNGFRGLIYPRNNMDIQIFK